MVDVRTVDGVVAVAALGGATWVATRDRVPRWELRVTGWSNRAPDVVSWGLWPVMQAGSAAAPVVVGGVVAVARRDLAGAATVAGCGLAAWYLAKAVKRVVQRGRPSVFLPELRVRERDDSGLGFVSGHAAVSAALAMALTGTGVVPAAWSAVAVAVAGVVGMARVVAGMHLPIDVVGGWSLGALLALSVTSGVRHQM